MATDLVSEIVEVVSPTISSRIASALGLDPAAVQKAIVVAAPVLIGALISYVSKAQGANKLNEVVRKQEPGMLSSLANVIGEPGQKALIDQGASVLTSLFGGKTFSGLSQAVGQYAGIGQGGSELVGTSWTSGAGRAWKGAACSRARCVRPRQPSHLAKEQRQRCIAFWLLKVPYRSWNF